MIGKCPVTKLRENKANFGIWKYHALNICGCIVRNLIFDSKQLIVLIFFGEITFFHPTVRDALIAKDSKNY